MPPRAAELAVGDRAKADLFLFPDDALDLAVLDLLECFRADLALGTFLPRLLEGGRAQQAADMVGAERRLGALHGRSPGWRRSQVSEGIVQTGSGCQYLGGRRLRATLQRHGPRRRGIQ